MRLGQMLDTSDLQDRVTVDGSPVKRGDRVWFWHAGQVRQRALTKTDLGMWWSPMTSKIIYSTERAALEAALRDERKKLKRARQAARRAAGSIDRLSSRLEKLGKEAL